MSSPASAPEVILTKEHRRFAEFCDAFRRYGYIGLCYGPPGVGKTLSAQHYANWFHLEASYSYTSMNESMFAAIVGSDTVFYTPNVVHSPGRMEEEIRLLRNRLRSLAWEKLYREQEAQQEAVRQQRAARLRQYLDDPGGRNGAPPPPPPPTAPRIFDLAKLYSEKRDETPDPTRLMIIDEAERLKTVGLEQIRDSFDRGELGVVLIGMPGLEKRLARYPRLYSRVGFVHEFRPLSAQAVHDLFAQRWVPSGVGLPDEGLTDAAVLATIIRITGGNFRLLHRLLTQIARVVEINALSQVTREVVEAARESLVIGTV
jgi:DNA transposition AAA+ family ATPase